MKNIYVGNLSFEATEESVRALFEAYGAVGRVNIVTDRDTGQPRGVGFVEMSDAEEAGKAIVGLNGKEWEGRALTVNVARPREERAPGGGGGGRREFGGGGGGGGGRRERY